jgi:hypothetical protein
MDRCEHRAMRTAHLLQGLGHMLEEVKAVRDLDRLGGALAGAVRIGFRPIACHDLDPRMDAQPLGQGAGVAIGEERHGVVPLHIAEDRPIRVPFPIGPIIHSKDSRGGMHRQGEPAHQTQESVPADRSAQALASLRPRRPAEGHRDLRQPLDQPLGPPGPRDDALGQALGEDPARAAPVGAEEFPDLEL